MQQIELPKNKFTCPSGWEWGGDWEMSKERTAFSHTGKSDAFNFLEVRFVNLYHK